MMLRLPVESPSDVRTQSLYCHAVKPVSVPRLHLRLIGIRVNGMSRQCVNIKRSKVPCHQDARQVTLAGARLKLTLASKSLTLFNFYSELDGSSKSEQLQY